VNDIMGVDTTEFRVYFDLASTKSYACISCPNRLVMQIGGQIVESIVQFSNWHMILTLVLEFNICSET